MWSEMTGLAGVLAADVAGFGLLVSIRCLDWKNCDLDISQAQVSFLFQSLLEDNCHMAAGTLQIKFERVSSKEPEKLENIGAVLS